MNPPTSFDPALLRLLCCPETRQPLAVAPLDLLIKLERQREVGNLHNRAGLLLTEPIMEGLVRADGLLLFPVRNGIPLLVPDEAVMIPNP